MKTDTAIRRENERYRRQQLADKARRERQEEAYRRAGRGASSESCLVMAPVVLARLAWTTLKHKVGL